MQAQSVKHVLARYTCHIEYGSNGSLAAQCTTQTSDETASDTDGTVPSTLMVLHPHSLKRLELEEGMHNRSGHVGIVQCSRTCKAAAAVSEALPISAANAWSHGPLGLMQLNKW